MQVACGRKVSDKIDSTICLTGGTAGQQVARLPYQKGPIILDGRRQRNEEDVCLEGKQPQPPI